MNLDQLASEIIANLDLQCFQKKGKYSYLKLLFVCFVSLCPKSTAMVMAERSFHLTTLFPGQA